MKCGYCGRDIPDEIPADQKSCGACGGRCRKVHCPHCGYQNPAPSKLLKKLFKEGNGD